MGRFIIRIEDPRAGEGPWYLEWSSVVDAPITYGLRLDEFKSWYQYEYGCAGSRDLENRLARVEERGHSAQWQETLEEFICSNHAGPGGSEATLDQIWRWYCLREKE